MESFPASSAQFRQAWDYASVVEIAIILVGDLAIFDGSSFQLGIVLEELVERTGFPVALKS